MKACPKPQSSVKVIYIFTYSVFRFSIIHDRKSIVAVTSDSMPQFVSPDYSCLYFSFFRNNNILCLELLSAGTASLVDIWRAMLFASSALKVSATLTHCVWHLHQPALVLDDLPHFRAVQYHIAIHLFFLWLILQHSVSSSTSSTGNIRERRGFCSLHGHCASLSNILSHQPPAPMQIYEKGEAFVLCMGTVPLLPTPQSSCRSYIYLQHNQQLPIDCGSLTFWLLALQSLLLLWVLSPSVGYVFLINRFVQFCRRNQRQYPSK